MQEKLENSKIVEFLPKEMIKRGFNIIAEVCRPGNLNSLIQFCLKLNSPKENFIRKVKGEFLKIKIST